MKWTNIDKLPDKTGDYLVCHDWEGHGGIKYYKVINFLHTAYDTPYMRWNTDAETAKRIICWTEIEPPNELNKGDI